MDLFDPWNIPDTLASTVAVPRFERFQTMFIDNTSRNK
jgi:hypothetical protein